MCLEILELVGLEDSTAPYESAIRLKLVEVGQLGQLQHPRNTKKRELCQLGQLFFVMVAGRPGLELVGLEDSTAPYESAICLKLVEVGQLG